MRAPPVLRGGPASRVTWLVAGLFLCACGIVCFLESELGLPPWGPAVEASFWLLGRTPLASAEVASAPA